MARNNKIVLPCYSVPAVERLRARLYADGFGPFVGAPVGQELFGHLVMRVHGRLPKGINPAVVQQSLLTLTGRPLGSRDALLSSWRLAGNLPLLRANVPVGPWTRQAAPEWVPVQVVEVYRSKDRFERFGYVVKHRVMAGTPASMLLRRWCTGGKLGYLIRTTGFRRKVRPGKPGLYQDCTELVSMRFWALLDPALSGADEPRWQYCEMSSGLMTWNRRVRLARLHVTPPCPIKSPSPCYLCHVGTDDCPAACHPTTFVWMNCPGCRQRRMAHPDAGLCLSCTAKK